MVDAARVAEVMGGPNTLGGPVHSTQDLSNFVAHGLPKLALKNYCPPGVRESQGCGPDHAPNSRTRNL